MGNLERERSESDPSYRNLIGEPVTRPDGKVIRVWSYSESYVEVEINYGLYSGYARDEIELLGDGDFMDGIIKIGQAHYFASAENFRLGDNRELDEEIKVLKLQQGSR